MNRLIRNTHLIMSLIATPFILMYAISSLFFAHSFINPSQTRITVTEIELTGIPSDPVETARILSSDYGVRGELVASTVDDAGGKTSLTFARAGTRNEIVIDRATGISQNTAFTKNVPGFIVALHTSVGIKDKSVQEKLWGVAVLCVAILIAGIVITGFLIWMRRTGQEKRTGMIFIVMSLVYCICVLTVIRIG